MRQRLVIVRVFGALNAGVLALGLLIGGVSTGSPWVLAAGVAAAVGGAVALRGDRWLTGHDWSPRDPITVVLWQVTLRAALVFGPLILLAAFG